MSSNTQHNTNLNGVDNQNGNHNHNNNNHPPHLKLVIPESKITIVSQQPAKPKKKKRRDKSDLGDNFVAPDGGWGWLVSIASGLNVLVTFAMAQQFGIIFRGHMSNLGISSSQLTTIINTQIAISAFTGLLNGPLFRRYSYRQVALAGALLTFLGLFLSVFSTTFFMYICTFSSLYGFGRGLIVSASSLAVNTYFKQKRRTATAYQFGVAGMGPICLPYLATLMLQGFGVEGTVLIFSGISLHTFACSLIYQPVKWHVRKQTPAEVEEKLNSPKCEEDEDYDIIKEFVEPETPILPRANDGWFGSRTSLNSQTLSYRNRRNTLEKDKLSVPPSPQQQQTQQGFELKRLNSRTEYTSNKQRSFSVSYSIKEESDFDADTDLDDYVEVSADKKAIKKEEEQKLNVIQEKQQQHVESDNESDRQKLPFYKKIIIFFDFDLFRDFTYVNLAVGLTLINFVEINFAILTPFILSEFGFSDNQIALAMSILGFFDLVIRFLIPLITAKLTFSNQSFFVIGILGMCAGRTILSFTRNFYLLIAVFTWLGLNKAFRTVFWNLIIAGYVPLKRLPAASGLQLLMSGAFSMICGPFVGLIRDKTNYAFTLNFLNSLCILAIVMWWGESFYRSRQRKASSTQPKV